jgi:O-antigen/teichoic acid export membrane protein
LAIFAKIQDNSFLLKSNFEKTFYLSAIIDKIIYIPMVLFAQVIIFKFMPQWKEAIPIFYIVIVGNIFFGAFSFSIYPLVNGVGRSDILAKLSFLSVIVTWVITWPLVKFFGLDGYAYVSSFLWVFGLIPTLYLLNKVIPNIKVKKQFILTFLAFSIACAAWARSLVLDMP